MAYTPTAWQDDETLVNAQRMNNIESGVKNANDNKSDINHNHDDRYSKLDHNHDDRYAKKDETYTKTEVDLKINPIKKEIKDLQSDDTTINNKLTVLEKETSSLRGEVRTNTRSISTAEENLGILSELNTTNKSSLVAAINEVNISGGGGSGTKNYEELFKKPLINGRELIGNKTSKELGLISSGIGNAQEVIFNDGETLQSKYEDGGIRGPQGPKGDKGDPGMQGERGLTGPQGPQGIAGPKGEKGEQGLVGPEGPQGQRGPAGPQGPQGPIGNIGLTGPKGEKGDTGPRGIQGEQGPKGETGSVGPQGEQGPRGDSFRITDVLDNTKLLPDVSTVTDNFAYLVRKNEEEVEYEDGAHLFILLVGNNIWTDNGPFSGVAGPQGPQGVQGEQGPQGIQGIQGEKGDKGDTGPQGIQGEKGEKGETGANGKDGVSPSVDISKSGKVTTITITDATGVHTATINDGEKGEKGDNGAIMISSGDDDTTTIEKLLSAIENNKIVKPAFYKNPNNEILTLTRFVIGFNKEKIFDFYKITNSEVGFIEFTISSDNTLTKNEKSIYWSEIIEETNSLKMEIFSFEGDGTTKVFTYTLSTMPGKLPIVNLYKPNSDGSASIIQENINFNFNNKTITITLNEPLEEGGLIGGSVLYDTSQSSTPI